MLMNSDEISQNEAKKSILDGLKELTNFIENDGPFFLGKDFGYADIALDATNSFRLEDLPEFRNSK